ncbi:Eco57I restriction-modification methylase domain-containing protein, partial [Geminocystis sp. GBBB08]|uniref:Eco57I restriction-modification methylase domain-containing protein n=1 Tax=Geminocystis sp. GBBB08 TaxID=2604140 RepID=UPI0027E2C653
YECYTGTADLYVYFYEQGLRLLKENGYLSYISSNKYFRAGYGEKLRNYLAHNSTIELLIDFGDANVFEAIAYPSIILLKKAPPLPSQREDKAVKVPLIKKENGVEVPIKGDLGRSKSPLKVNLVGDQNHQIKVLNWSANQPLNDFQKVYEKDSFLLPQKSLTADGWRLESSQILNLL